MLLLLLVLSVGGRGRRWCIGRALMQQLGRVLLSIEADGENRLLRGLLQGLLGFLAHPTLPTR